MSRTLRAYTNFSDIVIETTSLDSALSLSVSWELLCNFALHSFQLLRGILPGSTLGIASQRETGKLQRFLLAAQPFIFSLLDFYGFA